MKLIFHSTWIIIFSFNLLTAQTGGPQRIPLIGSKAPAFKAPSTNGTVVFPDDFQGKWKILFSHPRDFTPVCSSEILELAYRQDEFKKLATQIIILSVDRMVSHRSWKSDLENIDYKGMGKVKIEFPLVVDSSSTIAYKYGMVDPVHNFNQSVRGVFYIDPSNTIRAFQFYPNEVGRNTDEILRTLQALQAHDANPGVVVPGNWRPGDDFMLPFLNAEDKEELKKPGSDIYYINWYMIFKKNQK
jgi:peroxiredoxin (alkyl hydroperoxide reductase subunit C)